MKSLIVAAFFLAVLCLVNARPRSHKKRHHGVEEYADEVNPCTFMVCPKGSECTFNTSLSDPACVCVRECKPHKRPVCGSDGNMYDNHCELHRAACLVKTHIAVVADAICARPTPQLIGAEPAIFGSPEEEAQNDTPKTPSEDEEEEEEKEEEGEDEEEDEEEGAEIAGDAATAEDTDADDVDDDQEPDEETKEDSEEQANPEVVEDKQELVQDDPEMAEDESEEDTEEPLVEEEPTEIPCSDDGLEELKDSILKHYQVQFNSPSEELALPELDKKFLVSLMTNHFDISRDSLLTRDEISSAVSRDSIEGLSDECSLLDILRMYDHNEDGMLDPYEMYDAFDVQIVTIADDIRQLVKIANAGDNIVLVCGIDVKDKADVIWQRNGVDLVDVQLLDGMKTYDDGTLYFIKLTLMHMGTYSCYVEGYKSVKQTYTLHVRVKPSVHTCPRSRFQSLGKTGKVQCYAQGIPEPEKCWSKNGLEISEHPGLKLDDHNTTLRIENLDYPDTGKYMCRASNPSGSVQSISSVYIQENSKSLDHGPMHVYYLFHSNGIRVIEPDTCGYRLNIPAMHVLSKPHGVLCPIAPSGDMDCSWGDAVNVKNQYIYVTQPVHHRVIIIDIRTQLIVEVISTDHTPVSLHYIPHLDTMWVVCWRTNEGQRSIQVIKYASQKDVHTPIHTTPIGHHFDVIKGLFIPQVQIPNQGDYNYGYVVHSQQMAITKIDLATTTLASTIVLSQHQCYPESVAFLSTGGYVMVSCADGGDMEPSKQLVLDYLTDTVLRENDGIRGTPYISPDGQYIISADNFHGLIYVQKVSPSGKIKSLFEVSTNLGVSDIGFFPTKAGSHTYDILVTSRDRPDVLFVDLETSKVKMIPGVFDPIEAQRWPWNQHNRHIVGSGVFGPHVATPGRDHVVLIDGKKKAVLCDIDDVTESNVIVWVGECY